MSQWYHFQSGSPHLRLVVQREMRLNASALRAERTPLQIHHTDAAQLPRRLLGSASRPIFDRKIQGNRIETKIQVPIEFDDGQNGAQFDDEHDSRI